MIAGSKSHAIAEVLTDTTRDKIKDKKILYDHNADKKSQNKWFTDKTLKKVDLKILPDIISYDKEKYKEWID